MSTDAPSLFDAAAEGGGPVVDDPTRPLADRLRPRALADVVGQNHLLALIETFRTKFDVKTKKDSMCAAVITHGYSPPILDPTKHNLNLMPLFIQIFMGL